MAISRSSALERRMLWLSLLLTAAGTLITALLFGVRQGVSFLARGMLAGMNLAWLRSSVGHIFSGETDRSKVRVLAGFFLRLLLIPLCLYVMIRFLFLGILAAIAGFTVFLGSVLIEGILEAFGSSPE